MTRNLSLTTDPIPQLIRRIAVPASIGMFFNTLFNFMDTYCAGWLGTDALAGLSLSASVYFMLIAVGSGLGQGATALIANALGAGERDEARRLYAQAIVFAAGVGIVMSVAGLLFTPWLFERLGAVGNYHRLAVAFMDVIFAGGIFFLGPMTLNAALAAEGEVRPYRNFLIAGFVANCVLNPILMFGWLGLPALGVRGIALATVLVQVAGSIYLARCVAAGDLGTALPRSFFRPDVRLLRRIAAQSIPASLNMLTIALGIFVITGFVQHFGREAVAAYGIATRMEQIILMPAIGLSTAVLSLVGQNHGAGLSRRVREAWLTTIRYGVVFMFAGGVLLWLARGAAMRFFTSDELVIAEGSRYLGVAAKTLGTYPILFSTVFLMQGLKRPGYGLCIGLYRQVLAPVLVIYAVAVVWQQGLPGIWYSVCLVNWSAAIFAFWWGWRATRVSTAAADQPALLVPCGQN